MMNRVALTRAGRRVILEIDEPDFSEVLRKLVPYLHDEAHISHAGTTEDMVALAVLRHEVMRAAQAHNDALFLLQTEEARQEAERAVPEEEA